jgi:hypothetical protein
MRLAYSLVFAVACGGAKPAVQAPPAPPPDPIPATAGPDCKTVADHLATLVDHDPVHADQENAITKLFRTRCESDKWSDEVRSCMATAHSDAEQDGCAGKLAAAQHSALTDARAKIDAPKPDAAGEGANAEAAPATDAKVSGHTTRGAVKKPKTKGAGRTSDPCEGGE